MEQLIQTGHLPECKSLCLLNPSKFINKPYCCHENPKNINENCSEPLQRNACLWMEKERLVGLCSTRNNHWEYF